MRGRKSVQQIEFEKHEQHTKNPYDSLTGISSVYRDGKIVPVIEQGVPKVVGEHILGTKEPNKWQHVDRKTYYKVYKEFAGKAAVMPVPALRMFFYVLMRMKAGSDVVQFTVKSAMKYLKYEKVASIYDGLDGLIDAGVIARVAESDEQYFVNPEFIFNGNRLKLFAEGRGIATVKNKTKKP